MAHEKGENTMGDKIIKAMDKISDLAYKHPVATSVAYLAICTAATVKLYKVFGKIVAKEVVAALI